MPWGAPEIGLERDERHGTPVSVIGRARRDGGCGADAGPGQAEFFDLDASLSKRARWKSFGVEGRARFDPMELARPSRKSVPTGDWAPPSTLGTAGKLNALIAYVEAGPVG